MRRLIIRQYCIIAPLLRSQHQRTVASLCADGDGDAALSTQPQSPPHSPLIGSISEHRAEFWDATITIPLRKALMQLHDNPSLPRCLRYPLASLSSSPPAMSPTPESCRLTISLRSPVSPPAHDTPTGQELDYSPAMVGKSLKRGFDESDDVISNVDTAWKKRRCIHAVGNVETWGSMSAANQEENKKEARFPLVGRPSRLTVRNPAAAVLGG